MHEILSVGFLRIAFLGAVISALSTSLISVFIALKKVSYMSEAFAHMSFAGIALALILGWNINIITFIFVLILAVTIGLISKRFRMEESNITTIFLSISMALGVILISMNRSLNVDIAGFLFGNVLFISTGDLYYLIALFVINLLFIIIFFKEIFYIAYNEEIAEIYGINTKLVYLIFLAVLAANIVISVKITGIILITAQMILPGMTALNIIKRVKWAIVLSAIIALISSVSGFYLSFRLNMPSGAVIVIVMFCMFLLSFIPLLIKKKKIN